tara:strand:- start:113 stop:766 length:654 start_codon:yes stop_codon:yes gene_type:complete
VTYEGEVNDDGGAICYTCKEPFENQNAFPSEVDECPECRKKEELWHMRVKRSLFRKEQRQWDERRITDSEKEDAWKDSSVWRSITCQMCWENENYERFEPVADELGDHNEDVSHIDFYRVVYPKPGVKILCEECATEGGLLVEPDSGKEEGVRSRHIPEGVKNQVWRRDQGKCSYCGSNENLEYDHIIPHSRGGGNTARNLQLLCESCNRSKSDNIG